MHELSQTGGCFQGPRMPHILPMFSTKPREEECSSEFDSPSILRRELKNTHNNWNVFFSNNKFLQHVQKSLSNLKLGKLVQLYASKKLLVISLPITV